MVSKNSHPMSYRGAKVLLLSKMNHINIHHDMSSQGITLNVFEKLKSKFHYSYKSCTMHHLEPLQSSIVALDYNVHSRTPHQLFLVKLQSHQMSTPQTIRHLGPICLTKKK